MKRWLWLFVFIFGISTFCYAPTGPARRVANITVKEEDGSPSVSGVRVIEFSNGSVTDNADNTVTVSTGANHALDSSSHTDVEAMTEAAGDVFYYDGSNWTNLAKGSDGEVLKLASGIPSWGTDNTGAGSGAFSDAGDPVVLNTTGKNVEIGDTGVALDAKVQIAGDTDEVQLIIEGHSTQTDSILIVQQDDETQVINIENDGTILTAVGLDAIGNVDMDYGSADVDDHTFLTDGTGTAEIVLPTGSIDSTEILDNTIANADMADNSIDSDDYVDGSIDTEHYAAGSIDATAMGANSVDSSELVDGSVDLSHMSSASVDSDNIVDATIDFIDVKYDNTLAGNPTLAVDEIYFFSDTSGPGFISEGSTADTNEQLYRFPDANGADTTEYIVIADDANVSAAEAGFLDGVGAAIVDTGDAVTTAITGTGALDAGSITSNFGAIDNGASNITTTGDISGGGLLATGDTAAADNAAIGYTATEGIIVTGQGSTNDVTIKNDADGTVIAIPTGTTITALSSEIKMTERADHESTPGAGFGYLWTKNTTPSTLIFTDDAGTDTTLGSGGGGEWTDTGTVVHPTETGDDVAIGNTTLVNSSKLSIDGDADQVQLTVQGNSAQADSIMIIENSGGTEVFNVDNDGTILTAVGLDAIGAVDMDYGSADVTDHTFLTDGGVVTVLNDNTNTVALSMSGDRIFHDTNADGVKDGGEEFIDLGAGGSTAFDDIGDPDNNAESEIVFDNASETATFTWTGAFADIDAFLIQSETGNPTDGVLLTVIAHDTDVEAAEFGDNTNLTRIGSTGAISQAGTATLTLQDGSDLIITANDNAGPFLSATQADTMTGVLTTDGLTMGQDENITLGTQTLDHDGTTFVMNDDLTVSDEVYDATNWDGVTEVPTKNAVRDKLEAWNTGKIILLANDALLPTANFPDLKRHASSSTRALETWVLNFADAAVEDCFWTFQVPSDFDAAQTPTLKIYWMTDSNTNPGATETCTWDVYVGAATPDADDMDTFAEATVNQIDADVGSTTAGHIWLDSVTLTNDDSLAIDDLCIINLVRNGSDGNDDFTDGALVPMVVFEYTRTNA